MFANDELHFVKQSQNGDLEAFNRLVVQYQSQAFGVAFSISRDRAAAEDVVQESFISAYKNIKKFRGGNFKTWLLRIVTNASIDHLRSSKRRPAESLEESMSSNPSFDIPSRAESPEDRVVRGELRTEIFKGLETLHYDQRTAVSLVDIQGMDYEEAADVMDVSLGTLKSRLSRGRFRLRDYLLKRPELLPSEFRLSSEAPK